MVQVIQGCDISVKKYIDEFAGIFASLEEHFRGFEEKNIIPSFSSTFCPKHHDCTIKCSRAIIGFKNGGRISWRKEKRI